MSTQTTATPKRSAARSDQRDRLSPRDIAARLAKMPLDERIQSYNNGTFTRRELNAAAAADPNGVPTCNGELEWIALALADLD